MCLVGFGWGLWRYSPRTLSPQATRRPLSCTPAGCGGITTQAVFGAVTMTWIFSGLLSMDPWDWHPGTVADARAEARLFRRHAEHRICRHGLTSSAQSRTGMASREAEIVQVAMAALAGVRPRHRGAEHRRRAVPAGCRHQFRRLAAAAMPAHVDRNVTLLDDYDSYYYDRIANCRCRFCASAMPTTA